MTSKALRAFVSLALFTVATITGISNSWAYAGTLENGNLAYAASEFNKGEACDYLPGYETGYDAWHLVLTTRGATFMADPANPKISVNLNIVFMRTDGTKYVIKSGALVQFGKGAYVYTLTKDKDRIVQAGSLATINTIDSGMRLSHTCPGAGTASFVPTITPSPTPTPTPSPTPTATRTPSPSPTPTISPASATSPSPTATPAPSPTSRFSGTLENGNLALADSEFNKGEACDYLPGFETGYDAWHLVLTTRGATFIQDPKDPKRSIELNILFQRTNGTRYVITTGAWVQFGKGAYVYTPTSAQDRIVQSGTFAATNTTSSGMRLSHTCPGAKSVTPVATPTPSPTPTPTATASPTPVASPTPAPTLTPTPTPTPTFSPTPTLSPTPTPTPSPSKVKDPCKLCIVMSYTKVTPRPSESPGPGYKNVDPSPSASPSTSSSARPSASPSPRPTSSATPSVTPRPTTSPTPTASPTPRPSVTTSPTPTPSTTATREPTPTPTPTVSPSPTPQEPPSFPTPPPVQEPKNVVFVTPTTPTVVEVPKATPAPKPEIIVTEQPKYGTITFDPINPLTFYYVWNGTDPESTAVDKVTFTYKDVKGTTRVVTREFVLKQAGDVPRLIQTGPNAQGRCKPLKPTGTTVGKISVGNVSLPIKAFTYPAGGVMEPQKTTLSAGLSQRHMPLSAKIGTSVITWHVNYNGCWNALNVLTQKKVGSTFSVTDENGKTLMYRIDKKLVVKKGNYKKSWFTLVGPRQLALFTCTGAFSKGHYRDNWVLIATPVN